MKVDFKTVRKTINKAFLKEPIERGSFSVFKEALEQLLDAIDVAKGKNEHEEHFKNFLVHLIITSPCRIVKRIRYDEISASEIV